MMNYIFDYGATIDTPGNHWGMVIWHAYENLGMPVDEQTYRDAYVYGERTLGSNDIIKPTDTFLTTLNIKINLQFDYLERVGVWTPTNLGRKRVHDDLVALLYGNLKKNIHHSRTVLDTLKARGAELALVSNFYGNVETVLKEMELDDLFVKIIESAAVGIRKPDSRIYALGVEAIQQYVVNVKGENVKPEDITVVGDSIKKDIIPAKSLGCKTAWISGEGWNNVNQDTSIPDRTIYDLAELL